MRWLLFIPLTFILSGCAPTTSQHHILDRAKAEVSKRENWGDQAYIRVDYRPNERYISWRDAAWKVSAGALDYSNYPNYQGIRVIPGTERELMFTRDGCLVEYEHRTRACSADTRGYTTTTEAPPAK